MTYAIVAYTTGAVCCGLAVALDLRRHRDGLSLASVVWRVVVSAVLWPLVVLFAVAGAVARGRR
jgi:hypothetical protein